MTARELLAAGISPVRIQLLVRWGVLVRVGRGVYAPPKMARDQGVVLRLSSVLAVTRPGAVGSHRSAALIHALDVLGREQAALTVTHPPGAGSRTGRPGVDIHVAALPREHVTVGDGVPVTTVARTVVDLARTSSFREGVVVADSALRRKQTTKAELRAVLSACSRWPGVRQATLVVEFSDARSKSPLESISRVVFRDQGLPPPELQEWVGGDYEVIGRADFLWAQYGTIGEADGALKYADPERAVAQLRRDARLRAAGFEVVHFTWQDIVQTPGQVAEAIRAAFQRGAAS